MTESGGPASQLLLPDETQKYLELHPHLAEQILKAEKVYRIFSEYLRLAQPRVILRESGGSNTEVDLSAALSRVNR